MRLFLHGGGRDPEPALWRPFLEAAAGRADGVPEIAVVLLADDDPDAAWERWQRVLPAAAPCRLRRVETGPDAPLTVAALAGSAAVLVAHGLTPGYAAAVAPHATEVAEWLRRNDIPYAGSSAGSAVAPTRALLGGWHLDGREVCDEGAGEDLEQLTVAPGLGLLDLAVDVHAAQWGTVSRLVAAVAAGLVGAGIAIDEETVAHVHGDRLTVSGTGHVWLVRPDAPVRLLAAGATATVPR